MSSRVRNFMASLVLFVVLATGLLVRLSRLPKPGELSTAPDAGQRSPQPVDGGPGR